MSKPNGKNGKPKADNQASGRSKKRALPEKFIACQFKPGVSGNPKGGPKKPSLVRALTKMLEEAELLREDGADIGFGEGKRPPTIEELAHGMLVMGMGGNVVALGVLEKLLDRFDGRVPIKAELTGKDGDAITIRSARDDIGQRLAGQIAKGGTRPDTSEPN